MGSGETASANGHGHDSLEPPASTSKGNGKKSNHTLSGSGSNSPRLQSGAPAKVNKSVSSSWRAATHIGSVVDDWPMYSSQPSDYILGPTIGFGASSVVYQASFIPLQGRACAVKVIDLEAFGRDIAELRRETQLMSLSKHPNVLRVRGCWVDGRKLHIATRLMNAGSMLDIMRFAYPEGFDEVVIATVLKQALEGLNYLHVNGWLHRDLKAANVLVDEDGTVLLGDFGVGVYLTETGKKAASSNADHVDESDQADRIDQAARKSFVGTPCWMAPEVVERKSYGVKADIWSFGITALELSSGRAPHSRLPPVKVLMRTLQDEPPTLDRKNGAHQYSKTFDDFIRQCLQKDPAKRPTAERLLSHGFLRQAKSKKHLVNAILSQLPPLAERQERQRAMSIASLQNQYSWDFGSIGSTSGNRIVDSDPFSNFSGVITSPKGSVRSNARLVSIDGEHTIVEEADPASTANRHDSWRGSANARRSRPPSGDFGSLSSPPPSSWSKRTRAQRLSVSFHMDAVGKVVEEQEVGVENDASQNDAGDNGEGTQGNDTSNDTIDDASPKKAEHSQAEKTTSGSSLESEGSKGSNVGKDGDTKLSTEPSDVTSKPLDSSNAGADAQPAGAKTTTSKPEAKHNRAIDRLGQLFIRE